MTSRLLLRPEAKDDIREAFDWYELRGTGLGFEFIRSVRATLASIDRTSRLYPIVLDDIRRARLRRFPYSVFYVALPEVATVIAIMHDRRDPRRWQERS